MTPTTAKPSRSKTAAEVELEQRESDPEGDEKALKGTAREERKQQKAELAAGKGGKTSTFIKSDPAEQRTRTKGAKPLNAVVDNMTARDGSDPLEGHFVTIDYSKAAAKKAVQDQLAPKGSALAEQGFEVGVGSADYGVYLGPGDVGDDGYPLTGVVFLRDEHAARVTVPFDALRRSTAGGRR